MSNDEAEKLMEDFEKWDTKQARYSFINAWKENFSANQRPEDTKSALCALVCLRRQGSDRPLVCELK